MPSFAWLFDVVDKAPANVAPVPLPAAFAPANGVVVPSHRAQALIAYLRSLKQAPLATAAVQGAIVVAAPPAATTPATATPEKTSITYDPGKGKQLFTEKCAVCHQAGGTGVPGAFPPLKGNAAVNDADPATHIHTVLHGAQGLTIGGVKYSAAMPEFGSTLSDADIAAIVNYERSTWGNHGLMVTAAQVAAERAKEK
jgi:cytochrome c oxidase cbb3-type subunit 2